MKRILTLLIVGLGLCRVSSGQDQTLVTEVTAFVNKVSYSGEGLGSYYFSDDREKIRLDARDWETTLAEIINSPPDDNYLIAETAMAIVKLRESANNPEVSKAISSTFKKWATDLHAIEAEGPLSSAETDPIWGSDYDALPILKAAFVGFTYSAIDLNEPNIIQTVLNFAISENERTSPMFNKFTRRNLAEAILNYGDETHLDGLKIYIATLDGDEDSVARQTALEAISRIKGASTVDQAREKNKLGEENKRANIVRSDSVSVSLNKLIVATIILVVSIVVLFLVAKNRRDNTH